MQKLRILALVLAPLIPAAARAQDPVRFVADETLRIGQVDGPPELIVTTVSGIAVTADGTIWSTQPMEHAVVVYDASGRREAVLGREGHGPGEYQSVHGVLRRNDSIFVTDRGSGRTTVYVGREVVVTWRPFAPPREYERLLPRAPEGLFADGSVLLVGAGRARDASEHYPLFRVTVDGDSATLIHRARVGGAMRMMSDPDTGLRIYAADPIHEGEFWTVIRGSNLVAVVRPRLAESVGDTATAEVILFENTGEAVRRIRVATPARPAPEEAYDARIDEITQSLVDTGLPMSPAVIRSVVDEQLPRSPTQQAVDRIVASEARLLLREGAFGEERADWLILELTGEVVGHFSMPASVEILYFRGDQLWGTDTGSFGETYIVRYELKPNPAGTPR